MTENKSLPEIYREAANLVRTHGKNEGNYGSKQHGFCTMGAVLYAAGMKTTDGYVNDADRPKFIRLIKPVAEQLISSGRVEEHEGDERNTEWEKLFLTVYPWNDGYGAPEEPTTHDVVVLLRE